MNRINRIISGVTVLGSQTPGNTLNAASYTTSYLYTHLGQLWQGPLNGGSTSYQYLYCQSGPHQLTGMYALGSSCSSKSGAVYKGAYDAWGNQTQRTTGGKTFTLSYDEQDQLVKSYLGSNDVDQYMYDANGERTLRRTTSGGVTTLTVYAFGLEEYQYSSSGTPQNATHYYSLGGRLVGALSGLGNSPSTTMFVTNAEGSVLASYSNLAGAAALLGNQDYEPYGSPSYSAGSMGTLKGYTGQYSDPLTGLDYYNARYYDPATGNFLTTDSQEGNPQGMNPYAYVNGNPETNTDPTGKRIWCGPGGCGGGGGGSNGNGSGLGNGGDGGSGGGSCTESNCTVTVNHHTYNLNTIKKVTLRESFLQDFYDEFAQGYGTAELAFFNFLLKSGRLLGSAYWYSVDYQLARDQLLASFDFLNHALSQSFMVSNWLAFLAHPSNNGWWIAHNESIDAGDHQARADGLYEKESGIEQHFINETINVINQIQGVSQGSINPLGALFSPQGPTTGTLSNIFYPKQYNDASTEASFGLQGETAGTVGMFFGGPFGSIVSVGAFFLELT
jgi:RHS repeat-associated protein